MPATSREQGQGSADAGCLAGLASRRSCCADSYWCSLYGGFASFLVCTPITSWRGWQLEETVAGDHHQLLWGCMMPFGVTVSYSGGKVLERIKSERAVYGFKQDRGPY